MTTNGSGADFDGWLEQHLQDGLQAHTGPSPLATQSAYHAAAVTGGMGSVSMFSAITSAVTTKAAAGLATAALVAGGGAAVAATAATGSTDPGVWGQTVTQAVTDCKASAARLDQHGIGQCVSAIASQKGQQERALHSASAARDGRGSEARAEHQPATPGRGNATDHASGKPTDAGQSTDHPTGPPQGAGSQGQGGAPSNPGGSHR